MVQGNANLQRILAGVAKGDAFKSVKRNPSNSSVAGKEFKDILDQKLSLKFSKHAQKRLESRNINLTDTDVEKINRAVGNARKKGSRDSLVLLRDLALIVSVKNNTVVTAVNDNTEKDNVFTNIDSAVIAR